MKKYHGSRKQFTYEDKEEYISPNQVLDRVSDDDFIDVVNEQFDQDNFPIPVSEIKRWREDGTDNLYGEDTISDKRLIELSHANDIDTDEIIRLLNEGKRATVINLLKQKGRL